VANSDGWMANESPDSIPQGFGHSLARILTLASAIFPFPEVPDAQTPGEIVSGAIRSGRSATTAAEAARSDRSDRICPPHLP
jgi:hypothetical protein